VGSEISTGCGTYPFPTALADRQGFRAVEKGYVPILLEISSATNGDTKPQSRFRRYTKTKTALVECLKG
jgi:hypothetical protein